MFQSIKRLDFNKLLPIVFSVLSALFGALTSLLIARPLGQEKYGIVTYYLGIINVLQLILALGINFVVTKNAQFQTNPKGYFSKYFIIILLWGVGVLPFFFLLGYFFLSLSKNVLLICLLLFAAIFMTINVVVAAFLLGEKKAALASLISLVARFLLFAGSLSVFFLFGGDSFVEWYVVIYLGAYVLSVIPVLFVLVRKPAFKMTKAEFITMGSFFVLSLAQGINANLSRIIQGQYDSYQTSQGHSYNGILGLALQIMSIAALFAGVITNYAQPHFSRIANMNNPQALIEYYRQVLRVGSYVSAPFIVALIAEYRMVLAVFGESFVGHENYVFLLLIGISTFLSTITGPTGTMLTYSGHEKLQIVNGLLSTGVLVLIALLLMEKTIYGLPIAFLVSTVVAETAKFFEVWWIYKIPPIEWKTLFVILAISGVSCGVFFACGLIGHLALWLGVNVMVGCLVIFLCFVCSPFKEDKKFFRKVKNEPESQQH